MSTLTVEVKAGLSTEKQRIPVCSVVKGIRMQTVHQDLSATLEPMASKEYDLLQTNSSVFLLMDESFTVKSKALKVEVTMLKSRFSEDLEEPDEQTVVYDDVTVLVLEASNIKKVKVTNLNETAEAVLHVIY